MTSLAERQGAFLRALLDEEAPLPVGWGNSQAAGLAVYRGNYRSAIMGALAETFERTELHVGERAFAQASINHAIAHPPSGWTIDEAGQEFDRTCAALFADRPEVAELAWLEWAMLGLATAPDFEPLTPQDFAHAVAGFGDEDWGEMRLALQSRATARLVNHDLEALWRALDSGGERPDIRLSQPQCCLVWREGERLTFTLVEADHAAAFAAIQGGTSYGELIGMLVGNDPDHSEEAIRNAAMRAGAILGRWLNEGIVVAINP